VPVGTSRSDYCNASKIGLFLLGYAEFVMLDVIDLGGLRDKGPVAVGRIAKKIGRACRDIGFFYVRNHGIPQELMDGVLRTSSPNEITLFPGQELLDTGIGYIPPIYQSTKPPLLLRIGLLVA